MMGVAFLTLFISNNLIGWLGRYYERMSPLEFWLMHAGIGGAGALLVVLLKRPLERTLAPPS
jgi:POT family proton-dependent oligopeptide transporter